MRLIAGGFTALMKALVNGDPLWPAVTIFLVSILLAITIGMVRASRR